MSSCGATNAKAKPEARQRLARALGVPPKTSPTALCAVANAHLVKRCGFPCFPGDAEMCDACVARWGRP